jgi:hypothetical membrane protein
MNRISISGLLFSVGVMQFFAGLLLAEVTYPNYSVSQNTISSLGSMVCNQSCSFVQPAATIFNTSVTLLGIMILVGALSFFRESRVLSVTIFITGIGALGVGLTLVAHSLPLLHSLFSLITFVFAGLSAIISLTYTKNVLGYISFVLGLISLLSTILFTAHVYLGLGIGGMERMIVYPVLLWGISFGVFLISKNSTTKS